MIREELGKRILVLDGAMGTMLQRYGLTGDSESFNLTHPEIIRRIHEEYIAAGADIIETNTFGANRISQMEYGVGDRAREFALSGARLARAATASAQRKVWVAGSVGPTGKSLSLARDISNPSYRPYSFDDMASAYEEQIRALAEGGVDLIMIETCFDALNAKAALYALHKSGTGLPAIISVSTSDRSGRTLTGQTLEAFFHSVRHGPLLAFGLNCSFGAETLAPLIADVSKWADCPVCFYPNAGLPDEMGAYNETPARMASAIRRIALSGTVNIVGGCCGTTPEHIRAIADGVKGLASRRIPEKGQYLVVSGLETVTIDKLKNNFTNIGERTNVAGSRKFAKMIAAGDYEAALQVAADQIEGGASIIDINMDDAGLDSAAEMEKFLRCISNEPSVAKAAIMIDSSHWEAILAGLKNAQGKCIVNSISLKDGEDLFLAKALEIKALGAAVVVMAFDEKGQATTYERKIGICQRSYRLLTEKAGFKPCDIIFDANVFSVGTGIAEHRRYGIDFIDAVRWIKSNLPGALTSGGISNLSFAFRGNNAVREAMHSVFLFHAIKAGLDMGIVNPSMLKVYDELDPELLRLTEDVVLGKDEGATDRLLAKAQNLLEASENSGSHSASVLRETSGLSLEERLSRALVKGDSHSLAEDIPDALRLLGSPVKVIQGPLMAGMSKVGELFGDGKMFLPQVVKSAKAMRDAVALLQPYMESEAAESGFTGPKIVIATVKGDVHDIGKNITATVLRCNGFDVTDLGVMVPKETILDKAAETGADLICCSGLISPSLLQMEDICREMSVRGLSTPLLIGGATTSALHTAVKLAPLYNHVFYCSDASASAVLAERLMSDRESTENEEHLKQKKLRDLYESARKEVRPSSKVAPFPAGSFLRGTFFADIPARKLGIGEVLPYFNWRMFYSIWGIKKNSAESEKYIPELRKDAEAMLERMARSGGAKIMVSVRFDACHSEGDDIVGKEFRLPMKRQSGEDGRALSDFVAPAGYGFDSSMGMFAISVHRTHERGKCNCAICENDYEPMLERTLRMTLAEAASSWLDAELHNQLPKDSCFKIIKPAFGYASLPDHSMKKNILNLLPGGAELQIRLTESYAMIPDASICGLIFVHPSAFYPEIRSRI